MSSIKYYKDGQERINNVLRRNDQFGQDACQGRIISTSTTYNTLLTYTDAARHRKKPRRLLPTPLRYYSHVTYVPFDEFGCDVYPCASTHGRSGSFAYTRNLAPRTLVKRFEEDTGKQGTLALLAGSGFTSQVANYGESLASLSETGLMIHRRARQIAEIANALRRRNFAHLEKILNAPVPKQVLNSKRGKELSSGWLELEFGWKPLVQDVYTAVELYRGTIVRHGQLVKSQRFGDKFERKRSMQTTENEIVSMSNRVSARAYGIVSNPSAFTLNQLGLLNPALLAWQLFPFSFVVDWFLPISRILGHLTNNVGLSSYIICTTSERSTTYKYNCEGPWYSPSREVFRRVSSSAFPLTTNLSPRSLGLWHATAATALVAQSFGRRVH